MTSAQNALAILIIVLGLVTLIGGYLYCWHLANKR